MLSPNAAASNEAASADSAIATGSEQRPRRHESIAITRTPDELRIEWVWHRPRTQRWLLLGSLAIVLTCGTSAAVEPVIRYLVPFGLIVAYFAFAPAFNRTIVRLGAGKLRVYVRPVPFPRFATVRLAELSEFFVYYVDAGAGALEPLPGGGPDSGRSPVVAARLASGKEIPLLNEYDRDWAPDGQRILFVLEELKRELATGRWTVGRG